MPVSNRPVTIAGHDLLGPGGAPQGPLPHRSPTGALIGRVPVAYGPTIRVQDTRPWYIRLREWWHAE